MKKTALIILALILSLNIFAGCSASDYKSSKEDSYSPGTSFENSSSGSWTEDSSDMEYKEPVSDVDESYGGGYITNTSAAYNFSDKIIYTANVYMESLEFDESISAIERLTETVKGFYEYSYVKGENYTSTYYGNVSYRTAEFTIRVPSEHFASVKSDLYSIGNITSLTTYSDNVTTEYYDTQSRLTAYRTEETRLLELIEIAETLEEILIIEDRLSSVRYSIESLTTSLQSMDSRVSYSTIQIYLTEVKELTETKEEELTYWQQLGEGFKNTLKSIGKFFKSLFRVIVTILPVLIIIMVVTVVFIIIHKKRSKKKKNPNNTDE